MTFRKYSSVIISWWILYPSVSSTRVNMSVDDTNLRFFVYIPSDGWLDKSCSTCWAVPDASRAYGENWRVSTAEGSIVTNSAVFGFKGVAVFVYSIFWDGTAEKPAPYVNVTFNIDGITSLPNHRFIRWPTVLPQASYQYDQLVYSATGLRDTPHSLVITLAPDSVFLLDRADITIDDTDAAAISDINFPQASASSERSNSPAIIGGAAGGSALVLIVFALLCIRWWRKRGRRHGVLLQERQQSTNDLSVSSVVEDVATTPPLIQTTSSTRNPQTFKFLVSENALKLSDTGVSSQWFPTVSNQNIVFTSSRTSGSGRSMVSDAVIFNISRGGVLRISYTLKDPEHFAIAHVLSPDGERLVRWSKSGPTAANCIIEAADISGTKLIERLTSEAQCDMIDIRASKWVNSKTIYIPDSGNKNIIRWSLESDEFHSRTFQPDTSITRHQSLQFCVTEDEKWWVVIGRTPGSQGGGTGLIQIHNVEDETDEFAAGVACYIAEVEVYDVKRALLVVADLNDGKLVLRVSQLDPSAGGEAFNPVETYKDLLDHGDYPQLVIVFQSLPIIAVSTARNALYFFELHFGSFLFYQHLEADEVCYGSADGQSLIIHAIQRDCIDCVAVNKNDLIGYVRHVLKLDMLASAIAIRSHLPGAEDIILNDMHGVFGTLRL